MAPFVCGEAGGNLSQLDHALWGVRLTVLLQLVHWRLRSADVWTVEIGESAAPIAARLLQKVAKPAFQS